MVTFNWNTIDWNILATLSQIIMALATFVIIYQTSRTKKKEREFDRLREKVYFYSELMSGMPEGEINIDDLEKIPQNIKYEYLKFLRKNIRINSNYPLLSEPELNKIFSKIMPLITDPRALSGDFKDIENDIPEIIKMVYKDYEKLKEKYSKF